MWGISYCTYYFLLFAEIYNKKEHRKMLRTAVRKCSFIKYVIKLTLLFGLSSAAFYLHHLLSIVIPRKLRTKVFPWPLPRLCLLPSYLKRQSA